MENENKITLGGKNKSEQSVNAQNQDIPAEFIDTEFAVPTDDMTLPSQGVFYPDKQKTVKIKYLTADDENILTSPDLIRSGKVLDVLLENAVIDKTLRPEQMLVGDRNAILLTLRSTGYGDDYGFKMTCPKCAEEYEATVKLSSLKQKHLEVAPDPNGEFDVQLPKTKLNLKFRLLLGKDESYLTKKAEQTKKLKNNVAVSNLLTERYLLQVMEVNGNRDKGYIKKAVTNMPISDSLFLREYMREIEPGVDMEHEFECGSCGVLYTDLVQITARLFWPNARV